MRIAVALKGEPPSLTLWSWHDLPELVAALARENAKLQELLLKQRELTGAFIESSAIIASENQRLRAHIQEAADRANNALLKTSTEHAKLVAEYVRDWHLAALQPKEPNND